MSSVSERVANHMVLYGVSWESYTKLLEALGDRRLRHAYDRGTLEMTSPLKRHEWTRKMLARFIETASMELNIPIQSAGSTMLRREEKRKGLEPDECYYIQHEADVREKDDYDPQRDPPPDLAVEVEVTHSSVSRMGIYAPLGILEVWRAKDENVAFFRLARNGRYVEIPRSEALPLLSSAIVTEFLAKRGSMSETALVRQFTTWVRAQANKRRS